MASKILEEIRSESTRGLYPRILIGLALVFLVTGCAKGCSKENPEMESSSGQAGSDGDTQVSADGGKVEIEILTEGSGAEAANGQLVAVHYVGTLPDGTEFDTSYKRKRPFQFRLGDGAVIEGWEKGVAGMKVGEKRKLTIPPSLAYKERGLGGVIPPNTTLTFEIELMKIEN